MAGASGIAGTAARIAALAEGARAARLAAAVGELAGAADAVAPAAPAGSRFDRAIDAMNRLPRPAFALGALGLFAFGLIDPAGFALRMAAFAAVPEPLWWLLGGVVGFYFGARELHHFREARAHAERLPLLGADPGPEPGPAAAASGALPAKPSRGKGRAAPRPA